MSELYLIRHGQASFQSDNYDRLNATGHAQVGILADYWASFGQRFDAVYAGSLQRQRETAEGLLKQSDDPRMNILEGFNEYSSAAILNTYRQQFAQRDGLDAGANLQDLKMFQRFLEKACTRWICGELEGNDSSGEIEPFTHFKQRVRDALAEVMAANTGGRRVIVATSGGVIAMAVQSILDIPDTQSINLHWLLFNASVTRIRYSGTRRSLAMFNAIPHLERPGFTDKITYR